MLVFLCSQQEQRLFQPVRCVGLPKSNLFRTIRHRVVEHRHLNLASKVEAHFLCLQSTLLLSLPTARHLSVEPLLELAA